MTESTNDSDDNNTSSGSQLRDQLTQLEAARKLVLGDPSFYPQILPGILPIVGAHAPVQLRRWGADFLAEAFASPALAAAEKQILGVGALDTLKGILEIRGEDAAVLKSLVQACASLYSLVFWHVYVS